MQAYNIELHILQLKMNRIAHSHINFDVVEYQTHQRDIWLTHHEYQLQIIANICPKLAKLGTTYIIHRPMLTSESDVYIAMYF